MPLKEMLHKTLAVVLSVVLAVALIPGPGIALGVPNSSSSDLSVGNVNLSAASEPTEQAQAEDSAQPLTVSPDSAQASVYPVTGDDAVPRVQISFTCDGAMHATRIVRAGDVLEAPSSPTAASGTQAFHHWAVGSLDITQLLGVALTDAHIAQLAEAGGASANAQNLYAVTANAVFANAYTVRFHQYPYSQEDMRNTNAYTELAVATNGQCSVALSQVSQSFVPITDVAGARLTAWERFAAGADANALPTVSYDIDAVVQDITEDLDLYPKLSAGFWVTLYTAEDAGLLERTFVRDDGEGSGTLAYSKLPTEQSLAGSAYDEETGLYDETYRGWRPGYTLEGWYADEALQNKVQADVVITEDSTLYANWTARSDTPYSTVNMIEDETGTPGNGAFTMFNAETHWGVTNDTIGTFPIDDLSRGGYHLATEEELAARPDLSIGATSIYGDGSSVKYQYWFRNYYKVNFYEKKSKERNNWIYFTADKIKLGEPPELWAGDYLDKLLSRFKYTDGEYRGLYMRWSGGSTTQDWKYSVNDFLSVVAKNAACGATITAYYDHGALTAQRGERYYTSLNGDEPEDAVVTTKTFAAGTFQFVQSHQNIGWGVSGEGGLMAIAKSSNEGTYTLGYQYNKGLRDTSLNTQNQDYPYEGGIRESDGVYWKYVWLARNSFSLTFANTDGASLIPGRPIEYDEVPYQKKITDFFPITSDQATRVVGGVTYNFKGWYTSQYAASHWQDTVTETYKVDASTAKMPDANTTYYAAWEPAEYGVTYDACGGVFEGEVPQGGTLSDDNSKLSFEGVPSGTLLSNEFTPTKTVGSIEYVFVGWYKDARYTQPWDFTSTIVQGETTLYAKWVQGGVYNVTYHQSDGTDIEGADSRAYRYCANVGVIGAPATDPADDASFLGWSTVKDDPSRIVGQSFVITSHTDLFAVYGQSLPDAQEDDVEDGAPRVTLVSNYASLPEGVSPKTAELSTSLQANRVNAAITLPMALVGITQDDGSASLTAGVTGYHLAGWNTAVDGTGVAFDRGSSVAVAADVTLYAQWAPNNVVVDAVSTQQTYNAAAQQPQPVVRDAVTSAVLRKGVDYQLSYTNNVNACAIDGANPPTVVVTGLGEYAYAEEKSVAFSIEKARVTVQADDKSSVFEEPLVELTYTTTVGRIFDGDDLGITLVSEASATSAVGDYPIVPSYIPNSNYDVTVQNGTYSIVPSSEVAVDVQGYAGVYDGQPHGISVVPSLKEGTTATVYYSKQPLNESNYTTGVTDAAAADATWTDAGDNLVYWWMVATGNQTSSKGGSARVSLAKAALVVQANDHSIEYSDAAANAGVAYTGLVDADKDATGAPVAGVVDETGISFAYNSRIDATGTAYAGAQDVVAGTASACSDAGTFYIIPSGITARNYTLSYHAGILTVAKKPVQVSWSAVNPVYTGQARFYAGATLTGLAAGDEGEVRVGGYAGTMSATNVVEGGYTASLASLVGSRSLNYELPSGDAGRHTWFITQAANSATVAVDGWAFKDIPNTPKATAGFGEDSATFEYCAAATDGLPVGGFASTVPTQAGDYYVRALIAETPNYAGAVSAPVKFTIAKRALTVTAEGKTVAYGDEPPTYTAVFRGFAKGQDEHTDSPFTGSLTLLCDYELGSNVGAYDIVPSGLTLTDPANYSFDTRVGSLNVEQATNEWNVQPAIEGKVYDGTPCIPAAEALFQASGEPTFEYATVQEGPYSATSPVDAGDYFMRATVQETANYTGLQEIKSFTIQKATWDAVAQDSVSVNESRIITQVAGGVSQATDQASGSIEVLGRVEGMVLEYSLNGGTTWADAAVSTNGSSYEITGLAAGNVQLRFKEDANHNASAAVTVEVLYAVMGNLTWDWNYSYVNGTQIESAVVNDTPQERSSNANLYLYDGNQLVEGYPVAVAGATDAGRDATLTHAYGTYELHGLSAGRSYSVVWASTVANSAGDVQVESNSYSAVQQGDDYVLSYVGVGNFDGRWSVALSSADSDGYTDVQGVYVKVYWASEDNAALHDETLYEVVSQQNDSTLGSYCPINNLNSLSDDPQAGAEAVRMAVGSLPVWKMNTDDHPSRYRAKITGFRIDGVDYPCGQEFWSTLLDPLYYDNINSTEDTVLTCGQDPMSIAMDNLSVPMVALDVNDSDAYGGNAQAVLPDGSARYFLGAVNSALGTGYCVAQQAIQAVQPTWEGYDFEGWYFGASPLATNQLTAHVQNLTRKQMVYAHWSQNQAEPQGLASTKVSAQRNAADDAVITDAAGAPVVNTDGSINGVSDALEYQKQNADGSWPTEWTAVSAGATQLTGLAVGEYRLRYASTEATATAWARNTGDAVQMAVQPKILPAAPAAPQAACTPQTVTVQVQQGMQYSIDAGAHWVTPAEDVNTYTFTGLRPGSSQGVVARLAETDEAYPSPASDVTTQQLPKLNLQIMALPEANTIVYDGELHNLITPVQELPEGCTGVRYCYDGQLDIPGAWKEEIPQELQASTYYVRVCFLGDDTHNDYITDFPIAVTIQQATNEWLVQPRIDNWLGGLQACVPQASAAYGDVEFAYAPAEQVQAQLQASVSAQVLRALAVYQVAAEETPAVAFTPDVPTEPGAYVMRASVEGTSNYTELLQYVPFQVEAVTVTYDINSILASGTTPSSSGKVGDTVQIARNGFSWPHHIFEGWNTEKDGSGTAYAPSDPLVLTEDDVVLYAQWNPVGELQYNGNGADSGSVAAQPGKEGENVTVASNAFVRAGYRFVNWNTAPDGSGTSYKAGSTFTLNLGGDILYAQWQPLPADAQAAEQQSGDGTSDDASPAKPVRVRSSRAPQTGDVIALVPLCALASAAGLIALLALLARRRLRR